MTIPEFKETDIKGLEVFANPFDLRRDLHAFSGYVSENDIKRSHRDNLLPKAHLKRIAKIMSDASLVREVEEGVYPNWIDFIDSLSLKLDFVGYDIEGEYMGYTSHSPSFPDNYMEFSGNTYDRFLNRTIQGQEDKILTTLIEDAEPCDSEFFTQGPLCILNRFDSFGCATGTMKHIPFPEIRRYLFKLLSNCRAGIWYSTSSLIEYLKDNNPFFLVPEKLPKMRYAEYEKDRYHNFTERKPDERWGKSWAVGKLKDRFERVEGRFIERFLERTPLQMGYVEVAYSDEKDECHPSMNKLRAFRVTDRLLNAMNESIKEPEITVLPNYEIHIDSMFYPAKIMDILLDLCEVVTEGVHTILRLDRKRAVKAMAANENLDINGLLTDFSNRDIPENIRKEILSWSGHADNFIVYRGFGLLEGDMDKDRAEKYSTINIGPKLNIVRDPEKLYEQLEESGMVPVFVKHSKKALKSLPDKFQSRLAEKEDKKKDAKKRKKFTLKRATHFILEFPDKDIYEAFKGIMLDNGKVLNTNNQTMTVSYTTKDENIVLEILKSMSRRYATVIKEIK